MERLKTGKIPREYVRGHQNAWKMNKFEIRDECRAGFLKYTRKAFESIPKIENPNILDLGCGTGVPTLEMASLCGGKILAVDSDKECLDRLTQKIKILDYSDRVSVIHGSVLDLDLPAQHFDIILAEGIFNFFGFDRALKRFRGLLKVPGYFMIHDDYRHHKRQLAVIKKYKFRLLESFALDEKDWWNDYYRCLEKKIMESEKGNAGDMNAREVFKDEIAEINMYKKNPLRFRSRYYVLQKT